MGKSLKGKDCGPGIYQRSSGKFSARFVDKNGVRQEKRFDTLQEAKVWLADAKYEDIHQTKKLIAGDITVDEWFQYWVANIVNDRSPNTIRNYQERYLKNIKSIIGELLMRDVKPLHANQIFNDMELCGYSAGTLRQTYICMGTMFRSAFNNDIILKHPLDGVRFNKPIRAIDDIKFLTIEEQKRFLSVAKQSHNFRQYLFLLETGLRTGELVGLTFDCIDWKNRTITINKSLEYRHSSGV